MIVKLSSLLRMSLQDESSDLIPLQQELKFVGKYLDLEKMRFGSRLDITWSIDQSMQRILVPQLILQPLVENAIRHGVACSRDRSWVEIIAQRTNVGLQLRVSNNIGAKKALGTGVGLRNTRARLRCLYSDEATFSFVIDEDRTAKATIVLPALGAHPQSGKDAALADRTESEASNHAHIDCG
jgi:LytS/YehU family sensor histidine kinase